MQSVTPFDWHRMFLGNEPPLYFLEILFRVAMVYVFAVFALRLMGKRGNRKLSPFQTVVVIALGSASGDTMFYPQVPLLYAFLVILVVVGLDRLFAIAQIKSARMNTFVEGNPLMMVRDGAVLPGALRRACMRRDELMGMLREQGIKDTGVIQCAFLERDGALGIYTFSQDAQRRGESTLPVATAGDEML
ncbi:MAG: DUF421 domain-containing protein [Sphingomonas sp.]